MARYRRWSGPGDGNCFVFDLQAFNSPCRIAPLLHPPPYETLFSLAPPASGNAPRYPREEWCGDFSVLKDLTMNYLTILQIEHQLAKALIQLRGSTDPTTRAKLLKEMRAMIDQLERRVGEASEAPTQF